MKKLLLLLGFGIVLCGKVNAAGLPLPAKAVYNLNYTTTVSTVSTSPACVYAIYQSSGAAGEFVALFDSNTVTGITTATTATSIMKTRTLFSSTTANTYTRFDPPLQFFNGLIIGDTAVTGQTAVSYDLGYCGTN